MRSKPYGHVAKKGARGRKMSSLIRKLPTMPGKECTRATATERALVPKKKRR